MRFARVDFLLGNLLAGLFRAKDAVRAWARFGLVMVAGLVVSSGAARAAQFGPFTIVYSPETKIIQSVTQLTGPYAGGKYQNETYELLLTGPAQSIFTFTGTSVSARSTGLSGFPL